LSAQLRLCLTGNEPRQRYLFQALAEIARVEAVVPFDEIDVLTKYTAAALSFAWPRVEWWENFQLHPLMQRRRRTVLARGVQALSARIDALLMWGSLFQPFAQSAPNAVPFYTYIDESFSLTNLPGQTRGKFSRRKKQHALQARTYQAAEAILCMSEWARTQTLESHSSLPPSKVIAVGWGPCGVDLSRENLSNAEREPIVLHVSNDFHRKGIDYLVATAAQVRRTVPHARFIVIGKDNGGAAPPTTSEVEFLGRIADKEVLCDYFRRASVFFLPQRFDRSPHVLAEAMSAALPLVASAQGGALELIRGQGTGFVCEVGAIDQYGEAIVALLRDRTLRQSIGARGLARMKEYYSWPAIAARIVGIMRGNERVAQHAGLRAASSA
jgi:glycosyltransferase involved in cell wall biosynthesis